MFLVCEVGQFYSAEFSECRAGSRGMCVSSYIFFHDVYPKSVYVIFSPVLFFFWKHRQKPMNTHNRRSHKDLALHFKMLCINRI